MANEQLPLPGIPPSPPRRRTRHTFGTPSGQYATAQCRSCPVLRRYGPFGRRQGYAWQWKLDGDWQRKEIPCAMKRGS